MTTMTTTPTPDVTVELLEGTALDNAIANLEQHPASSALWQHLTGSDYVPDYSAASGAHATSQSRGRSYTYVSLPFISAQGATAHLVWDDLMVDPRAAYGLEVRRGDALTRVDVYQAPGGQVQRTHSLVQRPNKDVDILDAAGHRLQTVPLSQVQAGAAPGAAPGVVPEAWTACQICQLIVNGLWNIITCGAIFEYFVCLWGCAAIVGPATVGTGAAICGIVCGIIAGLVCWLSEIGAESIICRTWCG